MTAAAWLGLGVGLVAGAAWLRRFGRAVRAERARELFRLQVPRLEALVREEAAREGIDCAFCGGLTLLRSRRDAAFLGLVPVTLAAGGGTAVLEFRHGEWLPAARPVYAFDAAHVAGLFQEGYESAPE